MAETPELPEAKDPFERTIAMTIAIIAVVLAFVDNTGNNGQADAIVKTTAAANEWARYQSKSIKQNLAENNVALLSVLAPGNAEAAKAMLEETRKEVARYESEKAEIKKTPRHWWLRPRRGRPLMTAVTSRHCSCKSVSSYVPSPSL